MCEINVSCGRRPGADLADADRRMSSFLDCRFEGAAMKGATLTRAQGESLPLSPQQRAEINWVDEGGDEPEGG